MSTIDATGIPRSPVAPRGPTFHAGALCLLTSLSIRAVLGPAPC